MVKGPKPRWKQEDRDFLYSTIYSLLPELESFQKTKKIQSLYSFVVSKKTIILEKRFDGQPLTSTKLGEYMKLFNDTGEKHPLFLTIVKISKDFGKKFSKDDISDADLIDFVFPRVRKYFLTETKLIGGYQLIVDDLKSQLGLQLTKRVMQTKLHRIIQMNEGTQSAKIKLIRTCINSYFKRLSLESKILFLDILHSHIKKLPNESSNLFERCKEDFSKSPELKKSIVNENKLRLTLSWIRKGDSESCRIIQEDPDLEEKILEIVTYCKDSHQILRNGSRPTDKGISDLESEEEEEKEGSLPEEDPYADWQSSYIEMMITMDTMEDDISSDEEDEVYENEFIFL